MSLFPKKILVIPNKLIFSELLEFDELEIKAISTFSPTEFHIWNFIKNLFFLFYTSLIYLNIELVLLSILFLQIQIVKYFSRY